MNTLIFAFLCLVGFYYISQHLVGIDGQLKAGGLNLLSWRRVLASGGIIVCGVGLCASMLYIGIGLFG